MLNKATRAAVFGPELYLTAFLHRLRPPKAWPIPMSTLPLYGIRCQWEPNSPAKSPTASCFGATRLEELSCHDVICCTFVMAVVEVQAFGSTSWKALAQWRLLRWVWFSDMYLCCVLNNSLRAHTVGRPPLHLRSTPLRRHP